MCQKGVLKNFVKFTGKHLSQSRFFNKVGGRRPATLLKKRLSHRCFPVNFAKFLGTLFFIEQLWWLLLKQCLFIWNWTATKSLAVCLMNTKTEHRFYSLTTMPISILLQNLSPDPHIGKWWALHREIYKPPESWPHYPFKDLLTGIINLDNASFWHLADKGRINCLSTGLR